MELGYKLIITNLITIRATLMKLADLTFTGQQSEQKPFNLIHCFRLLVVLASLINIHPAYAAITNFNFTSGTNQFVDASSANRSYSVSGQASQILFTRFDVNFMKADGESYGVNNGGTPYYNEILFRLSKGSSSVNLISPGDFNPGSGGFGFGRINFTQYESTLVNSNPNVISAGFRRPTGNLNNFNYANPNGTWNFTIQDTAGADGLSVDFARLSVWSGNPNLSVTTSGGGFGATLVGTSKSRSVTERNNGDWTTLNTGSGATTPTLRTRLTGSTSASQISGSGDFSFSGTGSLGTLLAGTGSRTQSINYSPDNRSTSDIGRVIISTNEDGSTSRSFSGRGVAPVSLLTSSSSDAGFVLVGNSDTASINIRNTGDGNLSGLGTVSNLRGSVAAGTGEFSLAGSSSVNLTDGSNQNFNYTYTPTARGADTQNLNAAFLNGSQTNRNQSHNLAYSIQGQGVAPVSLLTSSSSDAGFVLVGNSGTASINIRNTGDGNLSGLGTVSNLRGSMAAGSGEFSLAGSSSVNLTDGSNQNFNYTYTPTARGADTQNLNGAFLNGSQNNQNQSHNLGYSIQGQGVAPQIDSPTSTSAGFARVGTTASMQANVSFNNVGDGNLSGLGSVSNLNGTVASAITTNFTGSGGAFSVIDGGNASFDYSYNATSLGVQNEVVQISLSNGSADGLNQTHILPITLSGQGVGPVFEYTVNDADGTRSGVPQPDGTDDSGMLIVTGETINFGAMDNILGPRSLRSTFMINNSFGLDMGTLTDLVILDIQLGGVDDSFYTIFQADGVTPFEPGADLPELLADGESLELILEVVSDTNSVSRNLDATLTITTDQGSPNGLLGATFEFDLFAVQTPEPASFLLWSMVAMGLVCLVCYRNRLKTTDRG